MDKGLKGFFVYLQFWSLRFCACISLILICFNTLTYSGPPLNDSIPNDSTRNHVGELEKIVVSVGKMDMRPDMIVEELVTVTADAIELGGYTNSTELFEAIPGATVDPARTQSNLILNGMEGEYVKLLMDGIPLTGNVGGGFPLENLIIGDISKLEVIYGASSAMYGSDAIGGIINIITDDKIAFTPMGLKASIDYGNNDSIFTPRQGNPRYNLCLKHGNKNFYANAYGGFNYDEGLHSIINDNDAGNYLKYAYPMNSVGKAKIKLSIFPNEKFHTKPTYFYAVSQEERSSGKALVNLKTKNHWLGVPYTFGIADRISISGYGSYRFFHHLHRTKIQVPFQKTDDSNTKFRDVEGEMRLQVDDPLPFGGDNCLLIGINALNEGIESDNTSSGANRTTGALFGNLVWETGTAVNMIVNPQIRITISEDIKSASTIMLSAITPKLAFRFNDLLFENTRISLAYGQAFKTPRLKKMFYDFNMGNSMWIRGNPSLEEEKSHSFVSTLGYEHNTIGQLSVLGFYNHISNMSVITQVKNYSGTDSLVSAINGGPAEQNEPVLPLKTYRNALWGHTYGAGFSLRLNPLSWSTTSVGYNYCYTGAENEEQKIVEKEKSPRHTASVKQVFNLEKIHPYLLEIGITALLRGKAIERYTNNVAEYKQPYCILNTVLRKHLFKSITTKLGVKNILNHVEQGHNGYELGRTYEVGITFNIKDITKPKTFFIH